MGSIRFFLFFGLWLFGPGVSGPGLPGPGAGFAAAAGAEGPAKARASADPAKAPRENWLRRLFHPKARTKKQPKAPLRLRPVWVADTAKSPRAPLFHGSPPLLTDQLVIQGNSLSGLKAFTKKRGRLVWEFPVKGGVFGALGLYRKTLYFGGRDGFFYSIDSETGRLKWKFWTGSENLGPPLIDKGGAHWAAANQNFYSLSLEGRQLWMFPGPSLDRSLSVRGRPRPAARGDLLYMGFYDGSVAAVDRASGRLKWKASLPGGASVRGLAVEGKCLFAAAARSHLFCLNPANGKIRWKARGGGAFSLSGGFARAGGSSKEGGGGLYHAGSWEAGAKSGGRGRQGGENPEYFLEALDKKSGKSVWRQPLKAYPAAPAIYKDYLVYGFFSRGELVIARQKDGRPFDRLLFGRGLGASPAVDEAAGEIYLLSAEGYLHKIRAAAP